MQTLAWVGMVLICLASAAAVHGDDKPRLPVPTQEEQEAAARLIADIYKRQYESAKTDESRAMLAQELMKVGIATQNDPAGKYVLYRIARDVSTSAQDLETAFQCVDRMRTEFAEDDLDAKVRVLKAIAKKSNLPNTATKLAPACEVLAAEAIGSDRYDLAIDMAALRTSLARQSRSPEAIKEARKASEETKAIAAAFKAIEKELKTSESSPDNGPANLAVGTFYCFVKNEWSKGIPLLARGSDERLSALAAAELSDSPDAVKLADNWWSLSEEKKGRVAIAVKSHSGQWYKQALPTLSGLAKAKAEARLAEISSTAGEQETPDTGPSRPAVNLQPQIKAGLDWLASSQNNDGSWSFRNGPNPGKLEAPIAATCMALLPFLSAKQTHQTGRYKENVAKGLAFVTGRMKVVPAGGDLREAGSTMYGQGIAAIALCEAYRLSNDRKLRDPAQASISFIIAAQDPKGGGWRYQVRQPGDTSVLGWQLTAIKSATDSKLKVPSSTLALTSRFLDSVQSENGTKYGYTSRGAGSGTTAIGLLSRVYLGTAADDHAITEGASALAKAGPSTSNVYFNYYATRLMKEVGGDDWLRWKSVMQTQLVESQTKTGPEAGSWLRSGDHVNESGGSLGVTSLSLVTLSFKFEE